jgi:toxin ParE1/3/4
MIVRIRPRARTDLSEISYYISKHNTVAARNLLDRLKAQCRHLAEFPEMGVARDDIRPGLRTFPVGNYLILYRRVDGGVEIVRVLHGARNWQELL